MDEELRKRFTELAAKATGQHDATVQRAMRLEEAKQKRAVVWEKEGEAEEEKKEQQQQQSSGGGAVQEENISDADAMMMALGMAGGASRRKKKKGRNVAAALDAERDLRAQQIAAFQAKQRFQGGVTQLTYQVLKLLKEDSARSFDVAELSQLLVGYDVAGDAELQYNLQNNEKIRFVNGRYQYKPRYDATTKHELVQLMENNPGGVLLSELKESYYEAENDVQQLVEAGEIVAIKNTEKKTEVLFPAYMQYEMELSDRLKEMWHDATVVDPRKLGVRLKEMGITPFERPIAHQKRLKKRRKRAGARKGRKVKDKWNPHVPLEYLDDSGWKRKMAMQ